MGIGDVFELRFRAVANMLGIRTAKPDYNDLPYDCLIKFPDNNKWFTAQIKKIGTTKTANKYGKFQRTIHLSTLRWKREDKGIYRAIQKRYDIDDFDYVVAIDESDIFLIPHGDLNGKYRIDLSSKKWLPYKLQLPSTPS